MGRLSVAWDGGRWGTERNKLGRGGGFKSGDKLLCFPDAPILNPKAISSAQRATTLLYGWQRGADVVIYGSP